MVKLVDSIREAEGKEGTYIAFEFYPPRTAEGVSNLTKRFARMLQQKPLYADITWGAGGTTSELTLEIATKMKEAGMEPNMHLTCTNMKSELITEALEGAKKAGISNIVALRGDPPAGQKEWAAVEGGFTCALDLVKHIRKEYGAEFGISVAGYPEGHPAVIKRVVPGQQLSEGEKGRVVTLEDGEYVCSDADYANEIAYLKQKVDAGADFIITQMFFDTAVFLTFQADCRAAGITVPIMPGIMVIQSYAGFKRMAAFCKSRVPAWVWETMDAVKDDDVKVKEAGARVGSTMCKALLDAGVRGLHFYTLNLEKVTYAILRDLGIFNEIEGEAAFD